MKLTEEQRELVKTIIRIHFKLEDFSKVIFEDELNGEITTRDVIIAEKITNSQFCILSCRTWFVILAVDLSRQRVINKVESSKPLTFSIDDIVFIYSDAKWNDYIPPGLYIQITEN